MVAPIRTTTRDAITAQKDCVTRISGNITPEVINDLEEELGGILVECKLHHFSPQGQSRFGHLGVILGEDRMRTIYGDPGYMYGIPVDQGPYATTILNNMSAMQRSHAEHIHDQLNVKSLVDE